MKQFRVSSGLAVLAGSFFVSVMLSIHGAKAATPDELRRAIESRSDELQKISAQIQTAQRELGATGEKGRTLNREIKRTDYQISQLNLQIRSGEIRREKLLLEIQALEYAIEENLEAMARKRMAIGEFLRALHERERAHLLLTLLERASLSESVLETQSLSDLGDELTRELTALAELKVSVEEQLAETNEKKQAVEAEARALKNRKTITEAEKQDREQLLRITKNQEKLFQQQLRDLEKEQTAIVEEIEGIEKELRSQIAEPSLPHARPGVLAWPAGGGVVSQGYGSTAFALKSYRGKHHNGIDIAAPVGTEVYAAEAGRVLAVGNQDRFCPRGAYGKFIVIEHENGLTTLYGHLSRQVVNVGEAVARGKLIGYVGRSGWATGPHVHFTVWSTPTYTLRSSRTCGPMPVGGDIDPQQYLDMPVMQSSIMFHERRS